MTKNEIIEMLKRCAWRAREETVSNDDVWSGWLGGNDNITIEDIKLSKKYENDQDNLRFR